MKDFFEDHLFDCFVAIAVIFVVSLVGVVVVSSEMGKIDFSFEVPEITNRAIYVKVSGDNGFLKIFGDFQKLPYTYHGRASPGSIERITVRYYENRDYSGDNIQGINNFYTERTYEMRVVKD
jgi:hypothetical protein